MQVNGHSYKPKVRFFGKDAYHLGVELEVEAPDNGVMQAGLRLLDNPQYCYAKHDGSLSEFGWELVTHPIAKKSWLAKKRITSAGHFFIFVQKLRELGYTSHVGGRAGLHIHVGLNAFNKGFKSDDRESRHGTHLYWFMKIVNSDLFKQLSQRQDATLNRWARIRSVNAYNFSVPGGDVSRYQATNLTNHTVEVRLFRGNMREDRVRKALESVIAAVEFSRTLTSKDLKESISQNDHLLFVKNFLKYVSNNDDTYPNLVAFLIEIGQLPEKKEGAEVCV
jgi:hypothetical protein